MASLLNAHCHLNLKSSTGNTGATDPAFHSFYYYACQAMLEVRSSGE